jgi:uncharacterized protein (UPF0254 family)
MLFAAVAHRFEGESLETLMTLKVEKSVICIVSTRTPTVSVLEQFLLFVKILTRNKASTWWD